ncbi:DUF1289 domain-containing protein [Ahrensia sp. R2A130]|uniref:DUF1289 domain-containing protein n=1 Tax=Ahrensia sp. R2A130 TaxID=744979 RepID=UPI0001E0F082|nr:DUF1289 domain-containing protein [Ahrensia sp. R2A130]EFL90444.1 putative Fe-S protein [Ahrensia sp. R2A130]
MSTISSPCILVCSIDQKTGNCFGCGRTGTEITSWIDIPEAERQRLMADELPDRIAKLERKPRRVTKRNLQRQRTRDVIDLSSSETG